MTVKTRKKLRAELAIHALAAVDTDSVQIVRGHVVGRWLGDGGRILDERAIRSALEHFINSPLDRKAIVGFTRRFGPLFAAYEPRGADFRERHSTAEWEKVQSSLQRIWRHLHATNIDRNISIRGKAHFLLTEGRRGIGFGEWSDALRACLVATPRDLLAECGNPDCDSPLFIRLRPQQDYCSPGCSKWAQRQWKIKWWNEHGREWRKQRAANRRKKSR